MSKRQMFWILPLGIRIFAFMSGESVNVFISRWSSASPSERANSQLFLSELCDVLGVPRPEPNREHGYGFEFEVTQHHTDGSSSKGRIDLYKRGCFVLESKQFQAAKEKATQLELAAREAGLEIRESSQPYRGSDAWDDAMIKARGQAECYVRSLPATEPNPPFLLTVDVGHTFEVFADFTQAGKAYLPFPDPRSFRIRLQQLAEQKIRERLKLIWTDPAALDPARHSADVTLAVSGHLAELAKSLEADGHKLRVVADFLTRCLFCMFAEDVGLLPDNAFTELLKSIADDGTGFKELLEQLFRELDTGTGSGISVVLRKKLLRFNGGLFSDYTALPVNRAQLFLLKAAALQNWRNVEPAIFGTLLERALNPRERHKLGAHYTPRAYVERLVLPTVVEPLRTEWESVRAAAITYARAGDLKKARAEVNAFHDHLCQIKVLDPACGSGNFLYVALEHLKRLEGEVLDVAASFGESFRLELGKAHSVDPHQFLGIEINPRAASITELVLWIGYLQWHFRTRGHQQMPEEPILKRFNNIECRDAVLAYDGEPQAAKDENGKEITVWDRHSMKKDQVTGREVPDETKRVPLLAYKNPRPAEWPEADFIVGNPPFLGPAKMREALGDGYAETLRQTYPAVSESTDFVMYWWYKAAEITRLSKTQRFGFITTNSLRQAFARRVLDGQMEAQPPLSLLFGIPDHPWVDTAEGAAVRIAMTVGCSGAREGQLMTLRSEDPIGDGSAHVSFLERIGVIQSDLTIGAKVSSTIELRANERLAYRGMQLIGSGFIVTAEDAKNLGLGSVPGTEKHIRLYRHGRDLNDAPRGLMVVDLFGMTEVEVRSKFPEMYQHVLTRVKPERDTNNREGYRRNWWIHGEPRRELRQAMQGLTRYIGTTETSKHRLFQFLDATILPDNMIVVIALGDAFPLGVLSSRVHVTYSLAAGGRLGVGNDPRYNKSRCFDPFPFPDCDEGTKNRIRRIAEELDAHRKRVQAQHPGLTLTGMYNVLEKLRASEPLNEKEQRIHDQGLVSVLKQLHDDLDAAVFAAYGWPTTLTDAEILERLVALNTERAKQEASGLIRWLRPDYQNPSGTQTTQAALVLPNTADGVPAAKSAKRNGKLPWPKTMAERVKAVSVVLKEYKEPVTVEAIAKRFSRAKTGHVSEILETLCTMGHAHRGITKDSYML
jgi:hypothetical protein